MEHAVALGCVETRLEVRHSHLRDHSASLATVRQPVLPKAYGIPDHRTTGSGVKGHVDARFKVNLTPDEKDVFVTTNTDAMYAPPTEDLCEQGRR